MENIKKNLFWIDPNVFGTHNESVLNKIKSSFNYFNNIYLYKNLNDALKKLKTIKLIPTILIISGKLYPKFILFYSNNLKDFNVILETIIFTSSREDYINMNKDNKEMKLNDNFFNIGYVVDEIEDLIAFLKEEKYEKKIIIPSLKNDNNIEERESDIIYEIINSEKQLICPIFYYKIFNKSNDESNINFLKLIISKYSNDSNEIKEIITPLLKYSKIPIEILYKYYLRIYSLKSNFVKEMNEQLKKGNCSEFTPFLLVLFEALSLKIFKPFNSQSIYHASYISKKKLNFLFQNSNKIEQFPSLILYTRQFLSCSKSRENAIKNFKDIKNTNYYKIIFEIEVFTELNEEEYCFNVDISNYSYFDMDYNEILVFPFSSFIINQIETKKDDYWLIKLGYIGNIKDKIVKHFKNQKISDYINKDSKLFNEFERFNYKNSSNQIINPLINYNYIKNINYSSENILNINSKIIITNEEKKHIKDWLNSFPNLKFELLYRLTNDGNEFSTFHKKCDGMKNNLIVIESKDGIKFGAFCPEEWESCNIKKSYCDNIFLFELQNYNIFFKKNNISKCSVLKSMNLGPILSTDFCFRKKNMSFFYSNGNGEYLPNKKLLTGETQEDFIEVKEVEIFTIMNINNKISNID